MWMKPFVLGLVGLMVAASVAHAETVTICDQRVPYTMAKAQSQTIAAAILYGVWDGEVSRDSSRARSCVGLVVWRADDSGRFDVKYVFNGAQLGISNVVSMAVLDWTNGKFKDDIVSMSGPRSGFELRKVGQDEMESNLVRGGQRSAKFKRRKGQTDPLPKWVRDPLVSRPSFGKWST
jgi:hypothetical protein